MPHPGIAPRQLQVSVTFYKPNRKWNETCFPWNTVNWHWCSLFFLLLYLNPVPSSLLFGLGFMSDISTSSFSKPWHTLRLFPVYWKFPGTPGVIKNGCQQAKHLPDSSLRTLGYKSSALWNLKLFVPNSCCLSFFSMMHWKALYHPYAISIYHLFLFKCRTKILIKLFCIVINCFTSSI